MARSLDAITKDLVPVMKSGEKELSEKALASKLDARLKILIACARSKSAQQSSEPDADAQVEAALVETVKEIEASGDAA